MDNNKHQAMFWYSAHTLNVVYIVQLLKGYKKENTSYNVDW
jgi:hypothetical protein